jgi:alkylation response protein AidB-like acyl-CoA dehydrogenase
VSERQKIAEDIESKREQFQKSVTELEHKLDVQAQRKILAERITGSYQSNPVPWWIGAGVLGVVVVSAIAWAVFGDD